MRFPSALRILGQRLAVRSLTRHSNASLALLAVCMFGCAGTPPASTEACTDTGLDEDAGAISLSSEMPVCGEHGVGFAAQQIGGGSVVRSVLNTELGFFYVVIDPACRFVAYAARDPDSNGIGTAYGGRLTAELSRELDAFLSLDAWSDGSRFELFVRDVVEFETPDGVPFVPWADLGAPSAR